MTGNRLRRDATNAGVTRAGRSAGPQGNPQVGFAADRAVSLRGAPALAPYDDDGFATGPDEDADIIFDDAPEETDAEDPDEFLDDFLDVDEGDVDEW